MDRPKFVYVSYIQASPEKVFNALMDPQMTKKYWFNHENLSDWKTGSRWQHKLADDAGTIRVVGKVIEIDPPKRLVISWVRPAEEGNDARTSRVTFEIESLADSVKLTVVHDEFREDDEMFKSISNGWPVVISGLKTLLETGKALPTAPPSAASASK